MPTQPAKPSRLQPEAWPSLVRWSVLAVLSLLLAALLHVLRLPAAPLLGSMGAAVLLAANKGTIEMPRPAFFVAQGIIGVMIAGNLPGSIFTEIATDWPVFLASTLFTLVAASFLGWLQTRSQILPGTTAIWGASPGAATAMTLMSEAYGADLRLVAFMQYLRVACCAIVAAVMARLLGTPMEEHAGAVSQHLSWAGVTMSLAVALVGSALGVKLRLPGGALLLPMAMAISANLTGVMPVMLPVPVLVLGYAVIGWGIGMRFTPDTLAHAARALPSVIASIFALICMCGGFAALLVFLADIDPLTAYLATSPGGADSVSIIAAATRVDMPFVIGMQVARFCCVILLGPMLARLLSRSSLKGQK